MLNFPQNLYICIYCKKWDLKTSIITKFTKGHQSVNILCGPRGTKNRQEEAFFYSRQHITIGIACVRWTPHKVWITVKLWNTHFVTKHYFTPILSSPINMGPREERVFFRDNLGFFAGRYAFKLDSSCRRRRIVRALGTSWRLFNDSRISVLDMVGKETLLRRMYFRPLSRTFGRDCGSVWKT